MLTFQSCSFYKALVLHSAYQMSWAGRTNLGLGSAEDGEPIFTLRCLHLKNLPELEDKFRFDPIP